MRKISEVLRHQAAGLSVRDIAVSTGIHRSTVHEYLTRAGSAGLSWPLPPELDEATVEARLFPPITPEVAAGRPVPEWREVHRELKRGHHVTLQLLWLEWRESHPDGWAYSQFCRHYHEWLGRQDVVMRLEYAAGERAFVDFAGDKMSIIDPDTGELTEVEIFGGVLGCSGVLYVEATRSQDLKSWLLAHTRMYEAYGGVPRITTPDNLKSGVTKACWFEPELNRSYLHLARHFNTVILPARPYHPRDKAAAEAGVLVVERHVLAPLRHRRFFSSGELNQALKGKTAEVNDHQFRGQPSSRRDLFEELERGALQPLPPTRYELTEIKTVTANIDYHVDHDHQHFYSVPHQLVRQKLELWATATTIEVYHGHRRVASHVREYGRRRYITDPQHMPASHRAHAEWTPSRLIRWARTVGPATAQMTERILESRPHPEHGYRACLGLMSLAKRHGAERVEAACARAVALRTIAYSSVKSILQQNLDRLPMPEVEESVVPLPVTHANLRGADYYRLDEEV
jgi:transposase